jgi:hypothetical protein
LPELPEQEAREVYERVVEAERRRVSPNLRTEEYASGTANYDDETTVLSGHGSVLVTAEHATDPVRKATGIREGADHGTGGLAEVLHEDTDSTVIIPIGRQTGNAAVNEDYPVKDHMRLLLPDNDGFVSVHGMIPGKTTDVFGRREVQAILGLGKDPSEMAINVAMLLQAYAKDLGLHVLIGNNERYLDISNGKLEKDDTGNPKTKTLAAFGANSTTNFAHRLATEQGRQIPAMQIEMTRMLRVLPQEIEERDVISRVMGVYMGYLLTKKAVELSGLRTTG